MEITTVYNIFSLTLLKFTLCTIHHLPTDPPPRHMAENSKNRSYHKQIGPEYTSIHNQLGIPRPVSRLTNSGSLTSLSVKDKNHLTVDC